MLVVALVVTFGTASVLQELPGGPTRDRDRLHGPARFADHLDALTAHGWTSSTVKPLPR